MVTLTPNTQHPTPSLDGLLVVDKPAGWTSHDVVAKVRRLTGVRRAGHAGTLDPAATGVMLLGVGRGTRVLEYLTGMDKAYRATIRLGVTTDTDDADGTPIVTGDWSGVTPERVREALAAFVGETMQIPPVYSALKQGGIALHRLARKGVEVQPPPRRVRIDRITVREMALPDLTVEVECSKGTYIRSLARDVGASLGCGAHLAALRRLRTGPFALADAHTLDDLAAAAAAAGALPRLLLPIDAALTHLPAITVDAGSRTALANGRTIPMTGTASGDALARAYGPDGAFLAVVRASGSGWAPHKVFVGA